jgi:NADPH-dependent curcumin reductase
MRAWLAAGEVHEWETAIEGLEKAPAAFIGVFQGANAGKLVVTLL